LALHDPLSLDPLDQPLSQLIDFARAAGASAADAVGIYGRSASITVRGGELEDIENAEGFDVACAC
jgi:PmbA protein